MLPSKRPRTDPPNLSAPSDINGVHRTKRQRSDSTTEGASTLKRPRCDTTNILSRGPIPAQSPILDPPGNAPRAGDTRGNTKRPRARGFRFIEEFPFSSAGSPISDEKKPRDLSREDLRDYLASCGSLGELEKFELAELLMTSGLKAKDRTQFLKSSLVKDKKLWRNNRALIKAIDRLPYGPKWITEYISVGEGTYRTTHPLFRRDIIEVIKELVGNARFKRYMKYAPERHWTSSERESRVYGEMWTGDWWWRMQYLIRDLTGTVAPLIIASDKTTLSTMSGAQQAYPVYLTLGNISKVIRRKASKRATVVLGYLPVDSFGEVPDEKLRGELRGELLHRSMEAMIEPLKSASRDGVPM
ncbi:hypothetical protein FRC06_003209, partial [Ceratobasidium sp. 370]